MQDILTKEQSDIASANHNLIYKFASDNGLNIEEYYGILAIGLCNAAKIFDESKGKFSVIAYKCMQNEVYTYWRSLKRKNSIPPDMVYSYDALISGDENDGNESFLDRLSISYDGNEIINSVISNMFIDGLTEKERSIIDMLLNGLTHNEIADNIGCTRQNVSYYIKQIRNKANDIFV